MSGLVLTYAPFGAPRATVFANIAADRWGWTREATARAFWNVGDSSPVPSPAGQLPGQLTLFA